MESIKVVIISEDTSIRVNLKKKLADRDIQIVGYADFKDESRLKVDGLFPDVVIVGVKVPIDPEVFSFVESMKFQSKGCAAVVATDDVTVDLVNYAARFGIRQVLPLDMKDNEFYSRVVQVNEYEKVIQAQLNIQKRVRSKVIAFFGCKGGTGKSVMATNLAVALSKRGSNVILLDMDLRFGDQNILLDLEPKDTIVELAQDPEGISIERVNAFSIMHSSGVVLLAAPKSPEYAEYIKPEHVTKVIRSVRPYYEYVIVDLGTNFSDETIAALHECDEIMIVNNPDILSLKAAKAAVSILEQLGIKEKARLVMNKNVNSLIRMKDFESMLEIPFYASISSDKMFNSSVNKGEPFVLRTSRTVAAKEFSSFIQRVIADKGE